MSTTLKHKLEIGAPYTRDDGERFTFAGFCGDETPLTAWVHRGTGARWFLHFADIPLRMERGDWSVRAMLRRVYDNG